MKTITLNLPDKMDIDSTEVVKFLAAKLYESGKLSLGQAAELASITKPDFAEILGNYGVSIINYPASDIRKDAARI